MSTETASLLPQAIQNFTSFHSVGDFFIQTLPNGTSIKDIADYSYVIVIGAVTGWARFLHHRFNLNETGHGWWQTLGKAVASPLVGIVGAIMGAEASSILIHTSDYTFIMAIVLAWAGPELMDKVSSMFASKLEQANQESDKNLTAELGRNKKIQEADQDRQIAMTHKLEDQAFDKLEKSVNADEIN